MGRGILFIFVLGITTSVWGQVVELPGNDYIDVETNTTNKIYASTLKEIYQLSTIGEISYRYSNMVYGPIASFDVSDPLRILLFYRESGTVVFLTHQFAEVNDPIVLDDIGDYEAVLACSSNKGGFWVYDDLSQVVVYINASGIEESRSQTISSISKETGALFLQEVGENVYLTLNNNTTIVFDNFGTYLRKIHTSVLSGIIPKGNILQFWNGKELIKYNSITKDVAKLSGGDGFSKIIYSGSNVIYLKDKSISIADTVNSH